MTPDVLIWLIVALAIVAIAWWAINQLGLPPPMRIVAVVIIALIAILVLLQILPGGVGMHLHGCP